MAAVERKRRHIVSTALFIMLFCYFTYHAVSGDHGMLAYFILNKHVEELRQKADSVKATRLQLEHQVSMLKPNSLDLDLLEEQSRNLLGYAKQDEIIYEIR